MTTAAPLQAATAKPTSLASPGLLLQRKCACGASNSSIGDKCEECQSKTLQRKLSIGSSNDPLELEADRVADQVMQSRGHDSVGAVRPKIQRFSGQPSGEMGAAPASVDRVLASSGRPLAPALRSDMEQRFGYDFSRVRVHSDSAAELSARDVNARAYTVGSDVVFGAGSFAPGNREGRRLIAHELTHVVQQARSTRRVVHRQVNPSQAQGTSDPQPLFTVFVADPHDRLNKQFARQQGQADAASIQTGGALSTEDRELVNAKLRFFEGDAKAEYLKQIKPALVQVTRGEIEMKAIYAGHVDAANSSEKERIRRRREYTHRFFSKVRDDQLEEAYKSRLQRYLNEGLEANPYWDLDMMDQIIEERAPMAPWHEGAQQEAARQEAAKVDYYTTGPKLSPAGADLLTLEQALEAEEEGAKSKPTYWGMWFRYGTKAGRYRVIVPPSSGSGVISIDDRYYYRINADAMAEEFRSGVFADVAWEGTKHINILYGKALQLVGAAIKHFGKFPGAGLLGEATERVGQGMEQEVADIERKRHGIESPELPWYDSSNLDKIAPPLPPLGEVPSNTSPGRMGPTTEPEPATRPLGLTGGALKVGDLHYPGAKTGAPPPRKTATARFDRPVIVKPSPSNTNAPDDISAARATRQAKAMPQQAARAQQQAVAAAGYGYVGPAPLRTDPQVGHVTPAQGETALAGGAATPRYRPPTDSPAPRRPPGKLNPDPMASNENTPVSSGSNKASSTRKAAAAPTRAPQAAPRPAPSAKSNGDKDDRRRRRCWAWLRLPQGKQVHRGLYSAQLSSLRAYPTSIIKTIANGRICSLRTTAYERASGQVAKWDKAMRTHMTSEVFGRGLKLLSRDKFCLQASDPEVCIRNRVLRPDWTPAGKDSQMDVDHIIELQLGAVRSDLDTYENYELLDNSTNCSAGATLDHAIQGERQRLNKDCPAPEFGPDGWDAVDLPFEDPLLNGGGKGPGERWTRKDIEDGEHLKAYPASERKKK